MTQSEELFSIGAFASLTRLSLKALRLYDQLNLLQPSWVDPQTGYRYYSENQLKSARMIRNMREMDMPLATIRQVLAALANSPTQAEALASEYAEMREQQAEQIRRQVAQFIHQIRQEQTPMSFEVSIKSIPTQQVLSITHHIKASKLDETILKSLEAFQSLVAEQKIEATSAPFGIFHGAVNEQEDGPLEICLPVKGAAQSSGKILVKQLSGGQAACVMTVGPETDFPTILGAYDAAADWIQANGHQIAESPREIWHSGPGDNPQMEIAWLFK